LAGLNKIVFVLFTLSFAVSCGTYPCAQAEIKYQLLGFTDDETDTIIYRRFDRQTALLVDSTRFDPFNPIQFARFGDTLVMIIYRSDALLSPAYDYEIYFPGAGRTIRVHDITEEKAYGNNKGPFNTREPGCVNEVTSYAIDGQLMHTVIFPNTIRIAR